jgi:GlpG protein
LASSAKGKLDPGDGMGVPPSTAVNALVFFLLCWIGVFGNVANFGHAGGLLMGITIGAISAMLRRQRH